MGKTTFLILSDSHGRGRLAERAYEALENCGEPCGKIIFLGDGLSDMPDAVNGVEIISVRGNCDLWTSCYDERGNEIPTERLLFESGLRIFITHGHLYSAKSGIGALIQRARQLSADVVLFGHTHLPVSRYIAPDEVNKSPIWLFNPGSLGEGSFGTLTISDKTPIFGHGRV